MWKRRKRTRQQPVTLITSFFPRDELHKKQLIIYRFCLFLFVKLFFKSTAKIIIVCSITILSAQFVDNLRIGGAAVLRADPKE